MYLKLALGPLPDDYLRKHMSEINPLVSTWKYNWVSVCQWHWKSWSATVHTFDVSIQKEKLQETNQQLKNLQITKNTEFSKNKYNERLLCINFPDYKFPPNL